MTMQSLASNRWLLVSVCDMCPRPWSAIASPRLASAKNFFLSWWFDYGQAVVREWELRPTVLGTPRPYLTRHCYNGRKSLALGSQCESAKEVLQ